MQNPTFFDLIMDEYQNDGPTEHINTQKPHDTIKTSSKGQDQKLGALSFWPHGLETHPLEAEIKRLVRAWQREHYQETQLVWRAYLRKRIEVEQLEQKVYRKNVQIENLQAKNDTLAREIEVLRYSPTQTLSDNVDGIANGDSSGAHVQWFPADYEEIVLEDGEASEYSSSTTIDDEYSVIDTGEEQADLGQVEDLDSGCDCSGNQ